MLLVYSIYDEKIQCYNMLLTYQTKGEAIRQFESDVNNPQTGNLHKYAQDFTLYEVGTFDKSTGVLEKHLEPINIIRANELLKQ
jgi:hypothetical protein